MRGGGKKNEKNCVFALKKQIEKIFLLSRKPNGNCVLRKNIVSFVYHDRVFDFRTIVDPKKSKHPSNIDLKNPGTNRRCWELL